MRTGSQNMNETQNTSTGSKQAMNFSRNSMNNKLMRTMCSTAVFFAVLGGANYSSYANETAMNAPDMIASEACTVERCVTDGG